MTHHLDLWTDFAGRATRLVGGAEPQDAIDQTIGWQLNGDAPFCMEPHDIEDLQLPELHSGAPWSPEARRPAELAGRWVAFVTLNPSLSEDESFPRLRDLKTHGPGAVQDFFHERFAPRYRGVPLRRGRHGGRVRSYERRTGKPRAVRTWSVLDNLLADALQGIEVPAPLGDVAAIIDAVPYKFRKWSAVPPDLRRELREVSLPGHLALLVARRPSMIVLLGSDTHDLLGALPPVADVVPVETRHGVKHAGARRIGEDGPAVEVLASYHPTSHAWASAGSRRHLTERLRTHLLDTGGER